MDIHHHFITFRPPLRRCGSPIKAVPLLDAFPAHLECRLQRRAEPELPQGFDAGMAPRAGATDLLMDGSLAFTFNDERLGKTVKNTSAIGGNLRKPLCSFYLQIYRSVHKLYNIFDHWVELVRKIFTAIPWSLPPKGSCRFSLQFWECILHRIIDFEAPTGKCVGCFVYVEI